MARGGTPPTAEEARRAYWAACERWQAVKDDPYSDYNQMRDAAKEVSLAKQMWEKACARRYKGQAAWYVCRAQARTDMARQLDDAGMPLEFNRKVR